MTLDDLKKENNEELVSTKQPDVNQEELKQEEKKDEDVKETSKPEELKQVEKKDEDVKETSKPQESGMSFTADDTKPSEKKESSDVKKDTSEEPLENSVMDNLRTTEGDQTRDETVIEKGENQESALFKTEKVVNPDEPK